MKSSFRYREGHGWGHEPPESSTSLLRSRQVLYIPMRGGVMLKDKDDPEKTVGASLRGHTIHIHWCDGFTPDEVAQALRPWWPATTDVEFPDD